MSRSTASDAVAFTSATGRVAHPYGGRPRIRQIKRILQVARNSTGAGARRSNQRDDNTLLWKAHPQMQVRLREVIEAHCGFQSRICQNPELGSLIILE